jgi:formate-dependent nitrite reductase membrane component NrfD
MKTATGFFLQGIGSSAQIIAALGDLADREKNRRLIRTGRIMAFLASPAGPLMFVAALHTPRRWYNMLRIFRTTSAMSIGIWTLTGMGLFNSLSFAGTLLEHRGYEKFGKWMDRIFGLSAAAAGGLVSIYMGSEIEETSTPIWIGAFPSLPPLVAATGFSNGAAALSLASLFSRDSEAVRLRMQRMGAVSSALQLAFTGLMYRRLRMSVGRSAIHRRTMAVIWPSLLVPVLLRACDMRSRRRALSIAVDVATLVGGAAILTSLLFAGKKSGKAPRDYFRLTAGTRSLPDAAHENRSARTGKRASKAAVWGIAIAAGLAAYFAGNRRLSK